MSKLAWDYIVPVVLPKDLKGIEPGKLPANLLKAVPGGGKMHWIAACAWSAMVEKAKAEGVELKPTSKKGMAMLATPGKSQHNLGLAVDVHSASEPKRLNWLIANVKEFGFSWEVVPSEPWHLRYVCGDNAPAAVKAWMEANGVSAPAAAPAAPEAAPKAAKPAPKAAPAASAAPAGDAKVRSIQEALKARGAYPGAITGVMDDLTKGAIKAFKVANKLPADHVPGPQVLKLLGL